MPHPQKIYSSYDGSYDVIIRRNRLLFSLFKKSLLIYIRPDGNSIFNVHDAYGLKLLTRHRLGLSHLRKHKFDHNFLDTINPLCSCTVHGPETVEHFLLHCPFFLQSRNILLDNVVNLVGSITNLSEYSKVNLLLYGKPSYNIHMNTSILNFTIDYLKNSGRFDMALI